MISRLAANAANEKPPPMDLPRQTMSGLTSKYSQAPPQASLAPVFTSSMISSAPCLAPYSTRARPGAPVSTPIEWSELGALKGANQYTVLNLPARLGRLRKDPWANIGRFKQVLPKFA